MKSRLYELPVFLVGQLEQETYLRWLQRKAVALARRDRKRWKAGASAAKYKVAIHEVVLESGGYDQYTGEKLNWALVSTYDNAASRSDGFRYKQSFALLPTVDHVDPESRRAKFAICGWRTNDCKNYLTVKELAAFCRAFLKHSGEGRDT